MSSLVWKWVVAGVLAFALSGCGPKQAKVVKGIYEAEGFVLGRAVVDAVSEGGQVLVLMGSDDDSEPMAKINAAHLRGMGDAFKETSFTADRPEDVATDSFSPMLPTYLEIIPDDMLDKCLAQYPDAAAIVSFVGVPSTAWGKVHRNPIPIFVGSGGDESIAVQLLKFNRIQAYVKSRPGANATEAPKRGLSVQEVFDRQYELVTR